MHCGVLLKTGCRLVMEDWMPCNSWSASSDLVSSRKNSFCELGRRPHSPNWSTGKIQKHTTDLNCRTGVDTPRDDQTSDQSIFLALACSENSYCHTYTQMLSCKQIKPRQQADFLTLRRRRAKEKKKSMFSFKYLGVVQSCDGGCVAIVAAEKFLELVLCVLSLLESLKLC